MLLPVTFMVNAESVATSMMVTGCPLPVATPLVNVRVTGWL
jgi:hypothetical protein